MGSNVSGGCCLREAGRLLGLTALLILSQIVMTVPAAADEDLTVERIFGAKSMLSAVPAGVQWVGDRQAVSFLINDPAKEGSPRSLVIRDVPSGKSTVVCIVDTITVPADLRRGEEDKFTIGAGYRWNRKGTQMVFSFRGDLFTIDADDGQLTRLTRTEAEEHDHDFSPDGKRIAYSRDHNLYALQLESGAETQLTTTGSDDVLNGILDWIYMEELFTRGNVKSFYWSPDSRRLTFLEITERPVPEFPLVDWIPVDATYELQRYPQAGDPNPIVRVGMVRADGGEIVWADTDTSDDSYIARLYWLGDSRSVALEKLNRSQDSLQLYFANAATGELEMVMEENADTWVNINYLKHYYEKKRKFVWGSERDGHSHLYLHNLDGSLIRQLTSGEWEVTALNGVNESKERIYFTASKGDLRERHFFEVTEKGKLRRITTEAGTHTVTLAPNTKYYIDSFSSSQRPTRISVHSIDGKKVFELGDQLSDELRDLHIATPEFISIEAGGNLYYCAITKPPDFDPNRKYPVIVFTYGGPHSQVVRNMWSSRTLWHAMMAQRGYIIFSLDNRGSFGRGTAWENYILKNMGKYELEDQLAGVAYLKQLPYVDADNIGIWGWSYGGYMTLMAMLKAGDVFKAGVAVAPVTDWRLYDTVYTERYMKRPQDNGEGYDTSSPLNFADNLDGALLLMHGDADDNVHVQNSIKMVRKLIDAGKDFDFMVYPQKHHGISGPSNRMHLYNKMTRFFDEHLQSPPPAK